MNRPGLRRALGAIPVLVALAAVPVVTGAGGPAAAAPPPVIRDCAGNPHVKPTTIDSIHCGDAGLVVTDITWRTWTAGEARGTGIERKKTCVPDCATGGTQVQPVDVRLSGSRGGAFTTVTLVNENGLSNAYPITAPR